MRYFFKAMNRLCLVLLLISLGSAGIVTANTKKAAAKYLNYREHKIYYEVRGNSPKTLIFIHGWASSIQTWKYQLDSFPHYKVLAIDLPGNGKSSKHLKSSYSTELFADSVYQVLKKEKIAKGFFIGHSMGFAVCEVITQKYPKSCAGICSMDGAHFELPEDPQEKENWIQSNRAFEQSMENESGREAFLNMLFLPDTPQILKDEVFKISKTVPLAIGKSMIAGIESDLKYWSKNRKVEIPCLAIYSPAYQLPPDYKEVLQKIYPRIEYHYIPNVSHFLMLEIPYKINQIIRDFLAKNY
jgi:pimeloyl-ACP methyl ester carboxylesterase